MTATKRFLLLATVALCCTAVAFPQTGVDNSTANGVFQMEGDATRTTTICFLTFANGGPAIATPSALNSTDSNGCPTVNPAGTAAVWTLVNYGANTDDWSSFLFSGGVFTDKGHSLFKPAFVTDAKNSSSDNTFLGAASKDTQDITQWNWNPHGTQDKDDIEHSFAGAYKLANGHTAIYAGMDRFANAGDSTAGFWFVQDSTFALCTGPGLAANPLGSGNVANAACTASGTFVGKHFDGDLLVVSDFSIGGAVSTINVFQWQGGSLVLDLTKSPAPCDPVSAGNDLCGLVNNRFTQVLDRKGKPVLAAATVAPGGWSFGDKGGFQAYQTGEFLEIAIDLNAIFGNNIPCFSTFFSETRSSTAPTASLSDLTTPTSFPLCSLSVSKSCVNSSISGSQITYNFSGTVLNTGSSTIYSAAVADTLPSGSLVPSANCGGVGTGDGCLVLTVPDSSGGILSGNSITYTGSFKTTAILGTGDLNKVKATASSSSSGTPLNVGPATADWGDPSSCSPPVTTGLTLTKKCESCLLSANNALQVQVTEAVNVCNTGSTEVTNITIRDCRGTLDNSDPANPICSTGFVDPSGWSGLTLAAAVDAQHPVCKSVSTNTTPSSTAACTTGNCSFADAVVASGTAAFFGTVRATPASTSCPLCPIATTCPAITF